MLLTLILCGLFYLYSYVSLNLQTSDNLLFTIFPCFCALPIGSVYLICALRNRLQRTYFASQNNVPS